MISATTKPTTLRGEILDRARQLTEGDRNALYGSPVKNFMRTAEIFNALAPRGSYDGLSPADAAIMMVAAKLARAMDWRGDPRQHEDTFVDAAAYIAITYEVLVALWDAEMKENGR